MEFVTLNRSYEPTNVIDQFVSGIWTERYFGDGDFELIVPSTVEMIQKLPEGMLVNLRGSDEIMIAETTEIDDEKKTLTVKGVGLLPWMNNRFIRATSGHADKTWDVTEVPGNLLWQILENWCVDGLYLDGTISMGIGVIPGLKIPGISLISTCPGDPQFLSVPYGPVYDAMKAIANAYAIGLKLMYVTIDLETGVNRYLGFISYTGVDRTSAQTTNPTVEFSSEMNDLGSVKEFHSMQDYSNLVFSFAPSNPGGFATSPGTANNLRGSETGFDLRARMTMEDDITEEQVGGDAAVLLSILNDRALKALNDHHYIRTIDGEIALSFEHQYSRDYGMGDLIQIKGPSGVVQNCRVTEYIRAQDAAGVRAYPTVAMID